MLEYVSLDVPLSERQGSDQHVYNIYCLSLLVRPSLTTFRLVPRLHPQSSSPIASHGSP